MKMRPVRTAGRLILGVDGEAASRSAVSWTAHRTAATRESVVVVAATGRAIPPPHLAEAAEAARDEIEASAGEGTAEVRVIAEAPSIPEALTEEAGGDPIVIGHHRTHPLRSALAGWLPLDIVTQAEGPVFVIPDDFRTRGDEIVVGVSRDGSARGAVAFALEEAERTRCALRLVLAETHPSPGAALALASIEEEIDDGLTVAISSTVAEGPPEVALAREAEGACLIVVGRHAGTAIEEVLLGATGHELMKSARVPICVVPPPEKRAS